MPKTHKEMERLLLHDGWGGRLNACVATVHGCDASRKVSGVPDPAEDRRAEVSLKYGRISLLNVYHEYLPLCLLCTTHHPLQLFHSTCHVS